MTEDYSLDLLGIEHETDKSSLIGDYLRHYERWLGPLRDEVFNLLEIGVFGGSSVRVWSKFFPKARIIGVDIDPACRQHEFGNISIKIGSQADPEFLHRVVENHPPQVIIDDGSHRSDHQIFTFERLFPALLPGGWYIIEDLHFNFIAQDAERLKGDSAIFAVDYFLQIARDRVRSIEHTGGLGGLHRYIVDHTEEVIIVPQLIAVRKKSCLGAHRVANIEAAVAAVDTPFSWFHFAMFLTRNAESNAKVIAALKSAIGCGGAELVMHERLADAYFAAADYKLAGDTLDDAAINFNLGQDHARILQDRANHFRSFSKAG